MNCEEVRARLSEFYDGELPVDHAAEISEHVNNCDVCTAELRSFGQIGGLFREQRDLSTAPGNWAKIVVRLDEQSGRFRPGRFPRSWHRLLPLMVASLIAAVAIGYWAAWRTSPDEVERIAAAHVLHGQEIPVRAHIEVLDGLSAHADQGEIMRWLRGFTRPPKKVYVVHGEPSAAQTLANLITTELGWSAETAKDASTVTL